MQSSYLDSTYSNLRKIYRSAALRGPTATPRRSVALLVPVVDRQLFSGTNAALAEEKDMPANSPHTQIWIAAVVDELRPVATRASVDHPSAAQPREVYMQRFV